LHLTNPKSLYRLFRTRRAQRIYSKWTRIGAQSNYVLNHLREAAHLERGGAVLPIFRKDAPRADNATDLGQASRTFVYVGRLNRWKGPQVAIEAMKQLSDDCSLSIVGVGNMDAELRQQVQTSGLAARVHFVGQVS